MNDSTDTREPRVDSRTGYQELLTAERETIRNCQLRWRSVGYLRGSLFLAALALLFAGLMQWLGQGSLWFILAGMSLATFFVIAFLHEKMHRDMRRSVLRAKIYQESVAQLDRDWPAISSPQPEIPKSRLATATDLDLFGDSSLWKLIGTVRTPHGIETLRDWILDGASPQEIVTRQDAVRELAPQSEHRKAFRFQCELLGEGDGPVGFVQWAESDNWLDSHGWVLLAGRITAVAVLAAVGLLFTGLVPALVCAAIIVAGIVVNFVLAILYAGSMHEIFNLVSSRRNDVESYMRLFDRVHSFDAKSEGLKEIRSRLFEKDGDARSRIFSLGRRVWLSNFRRDAILFLPYIVLQFLTLWDVHALKRLEDWKKEHGKFVRGWFRDLGQWESLIALAKLSADHPRWIFPDVQPVTDDHPAEIEGKQLGHPLIDSSRVCNDVVVGPVGTVLLVSGSNMSGKSTLLRSVGVNCVLGRMGSVVCADSMRMPPVHIETSMRIIDSLSDGVSFFMAELKRLKEIVDTAGEQARDGDQCMLFLLDEILQGTNSRERQIAVSHVVRKLIDQKAIGAISTHDLDLAKTDQLQAACRPVHFSEQFVDEGGRRRMTFDYRMKQGIAETTNALKLLEMVGLGDATADEDSAADVVTRP